MVKSLLAENMLTLNGEIIAVSDSRFQKDSDGERKLFDSRVLEVRQREVMVGLVAYFKLFFQVLVWV